MPRPIRLVVFCLFCQLFGLSTYAQFVRLVAYISEPSAEYSNTMVGTVADLSTNLLGGVLDTGNARLAMEAGFGILRSRIQLDSTASNAPAQCVASCNAEWTDFITIMPADPDLIGQTANVDISFAVSGTGEASAYDGHVSQSRYEFNTSYNGFGLHTFDGTWNGDGSFSGFPPFGVTNWTFSVTLGEAFPITSYIRTEASYHGSTTSGSAFASIDFARDAQWLSIDQISGEFGVLSDFTIQSASGNDWLSIAQQPAPQITATYQTNESFYVVLSGLSIAYTNVLEVSGTMNGSDWSTLASYEDATGSTGQIINLPNDVQFFRVIQE